jgi:two-component system chemotaxis sensor kinase CheA
MEPSRTPPAASESTATAVPSKRPGLRKRAGVGLRAKLLLVALPLVNVAFVMIWFLAVRTSRDGMRTLSSSNLDMGARSLADSVGQALADARADALTTASLDLTSQAIDTRDPKNFNWYADEMVQSKRRYAAIVVSDKADVVVGSNTVDGEKRRVPTLLGRSVAAQGWHDGAKDAELAISPGRPGFLEGVLAPGDSAIGFSFPVKDVVGDVIGRLTVWVSVARLGELLGSFVALSGYRLDSLALVTDPAGFPLILPSGLPDQAAWKHARLPASTGGPSGAGAVKWSGPAGQSYLLASAAVSATGPFGAWRVEAMKTIALLEAPTRKMSNQLLVLFCIAILLTTGALVWLATSIVAPIRRLTLGATSGTREQLAITSDDEVGVLTGAYNRMLEQIQSTEDELRRKAAHEQLERHSLQEKVGRLMRGVRSLSDGRAQRVEVSGTDDLAELASAFNLMGETIIARTRALKQVLDSMENGLVSCTRDGAIVGESSLRAIEWFGPPTPGAKIWSYLYPDSDKGAAWFKTSFTEIAEDIMPFECTADQMPRELSHQDKTLSLAYRQVFVEGAFERVLVVTTDVTAQRLAEQGEQVARELQAILGVILRDPDAYHTFANDVEQRLNRIGQAPPKDILMFDLHTLKGNAAILGFATMAAAIHIMESKVAEAPETYGAADVHQLRDIWQQSKTRVAAYVGGPSSNVILDRREYDAFLARLATPGDHAELVPVARSWRMQSVELLFKRLATQAERLASKLEKQVAVKLDTGGVKFGEAFGDDFWSALVHAVRNAVDHGIESPEEREAAGKPTQGTLKLSCHSRGGAVVVTVSDDGRGIDWSRLHQKASTLFGKDTREMAPLDLVCLSGLSTSDFVTDISGRGIGMGALRQATEQHQGRMTVESTAGDGTSLSFVFPLSGQPPGTIFIEALAA